MDNILRKAAEMALEALFETTALCENYKSVEEPDGYQFTEASDVIKQGNEAIAALHTAIAQPEPTIPDNMQDWAKLDGVIAWHLIERHADNWADIGKMMDEYIAAKIAAAQTEQEPVAWVKEGKERVGFGRIEERKYVQFDQMLPVGTKLYTAPPSKPWVSLTEDQMRQIHIEDQFGLFCDFEEFFAITRTIEQKSKAINYRIQNETI